MHKITLVREENEMNIKTITASQHQSSLSHFKIRFKNIFYLYIYFTILLLLIISLPKTIRLQYETRPAIAALAFLGVWRYSWWSIHVIRSLIYKHLIFPQRRARCNHLWATGARPKRLFFMMTTYQELKETTEKVLQSIIDECRDVGAPAKLFIGVGALSDETIIQSYFANRLLDCTLEVIMVRQKKPGKRFAIGETLRAMVNLLEKNDIVIFMDGDTFFKPGCLRLCIPFFTLYPNLQALTTHEESIVHNAPLWMIKWLDLRFAQRHFTMQSHSLSNKVLTLTGRMSIFRGKHLLEPEFIHIIEYDHLKNWLWGDYRFLSGDDKSTWYYLLKSKADLFYIPDATTVTIEHITGSAFNRMIENLRRWSGNTLRNGARAIALGPKTTGLFIWCCIVDQRISIWTMPIGMMITLILAITKTPAFLLINLIWIASSRLCLASVLFYHMKRIDLSYPFLLYFNQLLNSLIKIYIIFRLPQQRWKNRGNQSAGLALEKGRNIRNYMANYLTCFYCSCFLFFILLYLNIISFPSLTDLKILFNF